MDLLPIGSRLDYISGQPAGIVVGHAFMTRQRTTINPVPTTQAVYLVELSNPGWVVSPGARVNGAVHTGTMFVSVAVIHPDGVVPASSAAVAA